MKVLVTGAAGFIGSHLAEALLTRGNHVIAVDNFNSYYDPARKERNIQALVTHPSCVFFREDICNQEKIEQIVNEHRPDAIAHLAAYGGVRYSIGRAPLYVNVNLVASMHLLEMAVKYKVKNFVFASTSSVYGNTQQLPFIETDSCNLPLAPYPASKKAVEVLGHTYWNLNRLPFTALRFFSVYGPRGRPDMMPFMVTDSVYRRQKFTLFDAGKMKRDWTFVDDIVAGIMTAIDRPLGYEVINLGRGEPVQMDDFVLIVEELVGQKALMETPPAPASEPAVTFADTSKAQKLLDYHPIVQVREGMDALWKWYQKEVASV